MTCELSLIIAAAGTSNRYGEKDKLLEMLGDLPVFLHCVRNFSPLCKAENMVMAVRPEALELYREFAGKFLPEIKFRMIPGGSDRASSVRNALAAIELADGVVAIHDAARPLASAELLCRVAERAAVCGGAIAAVKNVDSLKRVDENNRIVAPVCREQLYRAETPQAFDIRKLRLAYDLADTSAVTDDAGIMQQAGFDVEVVDSGEFNLKLTTASDFALIRKFYSTGE